MTRPGSNASDPDSDQTLGVPGGWLAQCSIDTVQELVRRLDACASGLRGCLAAHLTRHGLSVAQSQVLWLCRQSGGSQSQLAQQLAISPAQVCGLVEQLRQSGLLAGKRSDADRRCQLWQLTAAGHDLLRMLIEQLENDFASELHQVHQTDLAPLGKLLCRVKQQVETLAGAVAVLSAERTDNCSDRLTPSAEAA